MIENDETLISKSIALWCQPHYFRDGAQAHFYTTSNLTVRVFLLVVVVAAVIVLRDFSPADILVLFFCAICVVVCCL